MKIQNTFPFVVLFIYFCLFFLVRYEFETLYCPCVFWDGPIGHLNNHCYSGSQWSFLKVGFTHFLVIAVENRVQYCIYH